MQRALECHSSCSSSSTMSVGGGMVAAGMPRPKQPQQPQQRQPQPQPQQPQQPGGYPKSFFLFVAPFHDGSLRAAHERCSAKKAATSALMVATRAADDRCGLGHVVTPLRPTGKEEGQGRGVGERDEPHGENPEDPHSPARALQLVRGRVRRFPATLLG